MLFVGEPEDVPDRSFGFLLPNRREYARRHYRFLGYVFPFDPSEYKDRHKVRAALGYDDRPLVVCAVGGTNVGADLLRLCAEAYPYLQNCVADVRMVLVCGPRLDPAAVHSASGMEIRGYVLRRPFVYFPLEDHFEQNLVVAERLARHGAGRRLRYSDTAPGGTGRRARRAARPRRSLARDSRRWRSPRRQVHHSARGNEPRLTALWFMRAAARRHALTHLRLTGRRASREGRSSCAVLGGHDIRTERLADIVPADGDRA